MRESCWLCEARFRSNGDLKKHLIGTAHRCLTVICPWCPNKEKSFTRISDLEVHVRSSPHNELGCKPREMFSRNAGFFFATNPSDYAKVVDKMIPYESGLACDMRRAVRAWADSFDDRKERLDKWNKGWKDGYEMRKRSRSVSESRSSRCGDEQGSVSRRDERHMAADRNSGGGRIDRAVRDDRLDRRKENSGNVGLVRQRRGAEERSSGEKRERIVRLQRDDGLDRSVMVTVRSDREMSVHEDSNDSVEKTENVGTMNKRLGGVEGTNRNEKRKEGASHEKDRREAVVEASNKRQRLINNGISEQGDDFGYVDDIQLSAEDREPICAVDERIDKIGGSLITEKNSFDNSRTEITYDSGSSNSSSSASTSPPDSLKARTIALLSKGVMPMCPPARRCWNRDIEFDVDWMKITWPPQNWRELDSEGKLFAMEQMALTLERKNSPEFPTLSKRLLCDKYNFLMLEGQEKPSIPPTESEKLSDKIRHYYASYLRAIVNGKISDSRVSWNIVRSLESAHRWTDTDNIVKSLEKGGVKIKL